MRRNKKIPTYLDGFAFIYRPKFEENKSTFGAKINVNSSNDMELIYKLAFQQTYKRLEDLEFAESIGRDLTLKIKVRLVRGIKNSDKIIINNILYDIVYIDEDRINQELYIYLTEVKEIE